MSCNGWTVVHTIVKYIINHTYIDMYTTFILMNIMASKYVSRVESEDIVEGEC